MELHRLHAQLHDRLPGLVRGVDRVHVGLYVGGQQGWQFCPDFLLVNGIGKRLGLINENTKWFLGWKYNVVHKYSTFLRFYEPNCISS